MAVPKKKKSKSKKPKHAVWKGKAAIVLKSISLGKSVLTGKAQGFVYISTKKKKKNSFYDPNLNASNIMA